MTDVIGPQESLPERLRAAAVEPDRDPFTTWCRPRHAEGGSATIIDLYTLAAQARGLRPEELPRAERVALAERGLTAIWPNRKIGRDSDRDPKPISIAPYDPHWPEIFASWRQRLAAAVGTAALRIDHIGSTAVPGLQAKPVIDIPLSVLRPEDEARYLPGLERCGLKFRARDDLHRYFRPSQGAPREVQVHVCRAGGGWEREHLLFRDFLRASGPARSAYAAAKEAAAKRWRDDRIAYTEAKTEVILGILEAGRVWARDCDWTIPGSHQ